MSLLLIPVLGACNTTVYDPEKRAGPFPGDPFNNNTSGDSGAPIDDDEEKNMTVYFYLDYSHSDEPETLTTDDAYVRNSINEPVFIMSWWMLKPLGACPERAVLTDNDAADPLYGKFLGYSEYPSSIDGSKLWDFKQDYKQSNILRLYGVWVSKV